MAKKIIAVSGRKFSGKSSLCSYLQAYFGVLEHNIHYAGRSLGQGEGPAPFIDLSQTSDGVLHWFNRHGNTLLDESHVSYLRLDSESLSKKSSRIYSFADSLKEFCVNILGLEDRQVWGTEEDKNTFTRFSWNKLPDFIANSKIHKDSSTVGRMTAREVMQVFGTDIMRNMFDNDVWINATLRRIESDQVNVAFISDLRFPSEFHAIHDSGGYVIRLARKIYSDDVHSSETALDDFPFYSYDRTLLIPEHADIDTKNLMAANWLYEKGLIRN